MISNIKQKLILMAFKGECLQELGVFSKVKKRFIASKRDNIEIDKYIMCKYLLRIMSS